MVDKTFWKAALIRSIKTFAQAMVAQIGAGSIGIMEFDWLTALSVSAMALVLSLFTSLAGLPEVEYQQALEQLEELRPAPDVDDEDEEEDEADGDAE